MNTKIVSSLLVVMVAGLTGGYGVMAWFSDTAVSTGNILDAAKVDLQIDGQESIGAFISGTNMLPDECVTGTTTLTNVGDRFHPDIEIDISIEYTDTDDMGKFLQIADLDYGSIHTNLQTVIPDSNGNGWKDLHDWQANPSATRDLRDPGAAGSALFVEICLRPEADNHLQSDSVTVDFTFRLHQAAEINLPFTPPAGFDSFAKVDVANSNAALSNHQVLVSFNTASLVTAGQLQADCDDLRFFTATGTAQSYWIESGCNSAATHVWFKASSLPSGTTTFYMLFDNPTATAGSSVSGTFNVNQIAHRAGSCPSGLAECAYTDNLAEMDLVRQRAANHCSGTTNRIDWGSLCDGTGFNSAVRNEFFTRQRFLFAPTTTGTWTFATDSDDASDLVRNARDSFVPSSTLVASFYGAHGVCFCTSHSGTTSITNGAWFDYSMTEVGGQEGGRLHARAPGAGGFSIFNTVNYPGQIFARAYAATEPAATVGTVQAV